jgi:hypothetical protein
MQPLEVGPFEVTRLLGPKTLSVLLPESYAVNNAFDFENVRPWFSHACQSLEPEYPAVEPHPSANPIIRILDRRRLSGRMPAGVEFLDIQCEYRVTRQNGNVEWQLSSSSELANERVHQEVVAFEIRYSRNFYLPCNPVADHPELSDGYNSGDELPIADFERLSQHRH